MSVSCFASLSASLLLLILTVSQPSVCAEAVRSGLSLCLTRAVPSLFPFFVVSALAVRCRLADALARLSAPLMRVYRLPACGISALLLGLLGGYPTGAQTVSDLIAGGRCTREDGARLIAFCNNTGPAFLVGMCGGGIFHSVRVGLFLYLTHLLSALALGFLFRGTDSSSAPPASLSPERFSVCLTHAVVHAGTGMLNVCSFILYFSVLLSLLGSMGILSLLAGALSAVLPLPADLLCAVLTGGVELTNGLSLLASCAGSMRVRAAACAGLCAFGGLSVLFQSSSTAPAVPFSRIVLGKLLHAVLCTLLTALLFPLCPL